MCIDGQERFVIRLKFRDFVGRYLIHCHNMGHEDAFMMVRWDIVEAWLSCAGRGEDREQRRAAGVAVKTEAAVPTEEDLG